MTIDKQAQYRPKFSRIWERYDEAAKDNAVHMREILEQALDALEAAERHIVITERVAGEKLEAAEKRIAEQREYYEGVIADGSKRIAELREWNAGLAQESFERQQRIAEFSGQKRLIGWRASDYTDETSDPELAKNWAAAIGVLPIFEGDVNTKLSAAGIGKGE
ncbi:ead/Ea22-like family protein [Citrobacter koseri]|uniref:ead/Ea22-like family protein n=1 Tax=Citrobacter koseri TaxID=545 RepID=UPI00387E1C44